MYSRWLDIGEDVPTEKRKLTLAMPDKEKGGIDKSAAATQHILTPGRSESMEICGARFRREGVLWIGDLMSEFGLLEVLLDGTSEAPNPGHVAAFRRFSANLKDNLRQVRRHLKMAFLYEPFRIAPNMENQVGIQFRNRITGRQLNMLFWDDVPARHP